MTPRSTAVRRLGPGVFRRAFWRFQKRPSFLRPLVGRGRGLDVTSLRPTTLHTSRRPATLIESRRPAPLVTSPNEL